MFIEKIEINDLRHLKGMSIDLGQSKKHLILTGKNGSGKTSLLEQVHIFVKNIQRFNDIEYNKMLSSINNWNKEIEDLRKLLVMTNEQKSQFLTFSNAKENYEKMINDNYKVLITYNDTLEIIEKLKEYGFFIGFFNASRQLKLKQSDGVQKIDVNSLHKNNGLNQNLFLKYMVHLKTQLSYAKDDNEVEEVKKYNDWFIRLEKLLKELFENNQITLKYDRREYNFLINDGVKTFDFTKLSAGFSAVLDVLAGIMMAMEKDEEKLHNYDMPGIVFVDEIETHLHVSLQRKIFKILDEFFPKIQFIITTHSPFVLNSVKNCIIYDLEGQDRVEDLTGFSYDVITESFLNQDKYDNKNKEKLVEYEKLAFKDRTEEEEDSFYDLRNELIKITSPEELRNRFLDIEVRRKNV